jgi:inorganic pyrophosphatase
MPNLNQLAAFDPNSGQVNVIIETPKGSRHKFKYDEDQGLFRLSKTLAEGMYFPFDFGFVPSTRAEDGDPSDVLVLMDEPAFPGCLVQARLLGVIEAEQTDPGAEPTRNDRLIAIHADSHGHSKHRSLKDLDDALLNGIEHFFVSYQEIRDTCFRPLGRRSPRHAEKLVRRAEQRFRDEACDNGKYARAK